MNNNDNMTQQYLWEAANAAVKNLLPQNKYISKQKFNNLGSISRNQKSDNKINEI